MPKISTSATVFAVLSWATLSTIQATEIHVTVSGKDTNPGSQAEPLRTIQRAAELAQPGDTITVHEGIYRERVNPPRGGISDANRIVYQTAAGEKVEIKGSEVVKGWVKVQDDVWKTTLPNSFFGAFNPYRDLINGDWFAPLGREHHTGAVYLNGDWLIEAAKLEDVLKPAGQTSAKSRTGDNLLNVAWFRPGSSTGPAGRIPAVNYAAHQGVKNAPCLEGGECIGWIENGDWVRYEKVNFGERTEVVEIRAASETSGGQIELRLGGPEGELLGTCTVPNTRGWQAWSTFSTTIKPTSGTKSLCLFFKKPQAPGASNQRWFGKVDASTTTIWAQFPGVNPNEQLVEINVRRTIFYPDQPGRNFITVRGFTMRHAATPWAPPTAEQVGLIGTNWSKGWIIEDNVISHSICSGIALGKYGDQFDNTSRNTAEGYVKTIERAHAHAIAWTKENIGHHIVRNNTISHCEQAGIVGSLGCSFSSVTGNVIHDIHVRRLFSGAEMAGIKFHGAIDVDIARNHIYRTCRGLWLDWMAQGTRVRRNLFHDNAAEDLFLEVNHGPFVVDNNIFLSRVSVLDVSEGGAFAHNLITGRIISHPEKGRATPYHPAHSTMVAGLINTQGGDYRYYNNIFVGSGNGLAAYDARQAPIFTGGNCYYHGAQPYRGEIKAAVQAEVDPKVKIVLQDKRHVLHFNPGKELEQVNTTLVTTALLGKAKISSLPYENADGTALTIDADYFGNRRDLSRPMPGPFENSGKGELKVW